MIAGAPGAASPRAWRPRRSVLFTPGTRADRWAKALQGPADVAIADLEDAVAPGDKDAARGAVAKALEASAPARVERGVRINAWPSAWAEADLAALAPLQPDLVALPKAESPDAVREVTRALRAHGCEAGLLLLLETPQGVLHAGALAAASPRVRAVAFGAEDYAAAVGARRTREGTEVLWARSQVVAAAAAAGVDAIDQVFVALRDLEGLEQEARFAAHLGFAGKMVLHPEQVAPVHHAFQPTEAEVAAARRILDAVRAAGAREGGVVVVEGRMVDKPLLRQAERVLARADVGP